MILTCPACSTRYQTDRARFTTPGMNVRCAKCGHVWFHTLAEVEPEPQPEPALEPEGAPAPGVSAPAAPQESDGFRVGAFAPERPEKLQPSAASAPVRQPRRKVGWSPAIAAGWAGLLIFLGVVVWGTVNYRQNISELWPRMSSFYAVVGMPVNVRGLAFQDVAYTQEFEEGQPVLSITGNVVNVTKRELPVPDIRISLSDTDQHELYHWNFGVGVPTLKPGETKPFVTRLTGPPMDARSVDVRFVQADDVPRQN